LKKLVCLTLSQYKLIAHSQKEPTRFQDTISLFGPTAHLSALAFSLAKEHAQFYL